MYKNEQEFICSVCQCTFIDPKRENTERCAAHRDLPDAGEQKVKYYHKDISKAALADRIEKIEREVAELTDLVTKERPGYKKTCEKCKQEFKATSPNVKTCPVCKSGMQKKGN